MQMQNIYFSFKQGSFINVFLTVLLPCLDMKIDERVNENAVFYHIGLNTDTLSHTF